MAAVAVDSESEYDFDNDTAEESGDELELLSDEDSLPNEAIKPVNIFVNGKYILTTRPRMLEYNKLISVVHFIKSLHFHDKMNENNDVKKTVMYNPYLDVDRSRRPTPGRSDYIDNFIGKIKIFHKEEDAMNSDTFNLPQDKNRKINVYNEKYLRKHSVRKPKYGGEIYMYIGIYWFGIRPTFPSFIGWRNPLNGAIDIQIKVDDLTVSQNDVTTTPITIWNDKQSLLDGYGHKHLLEYLNLQHIQKGKIIVKSVFGLEPQVGDRNFFSNGRSSVTHIGTVRTVNDDGSFTVKVDDKDPNDLLSLKLGILKVIANLEYNDTKIFKYIIPYDAMDGKDVDFDPEKWRWKEKEIKKRSNPKLLFEFKTTVEPVILTKRPGEVDGKEPINVIESSMDPVSMDALHGEHPVVTTCGHIFTYKTVTRWLIENNTCPFCRTKIKEGTKVVLYKARQKDATATSGSKRSLSEAEEGLIVYNERPPTCTLRF